MIYTGQYGGKAEIEKDGEKQTLDVPPLVVLLRAGPFIEQVTITHPPLVRETFEKEGKSVPAKIVNALIDTGASSTVITPDIADELGLTHTGYGKVVSVQDEQDQPVYYGFIMFPWGNGKEIPITACPLKGFQCLIGRDILQHWYFTYNGPNGSVVICD